MDEMPALPYHLLNIEKYVLENISYQSSRGCAHRCTFCYNHLFNQFKFRPINSDKVLDDIEHIYSIFHPERIHFVDDNFFQSKKRVEEICKGLIDRNIKISWDTTCRLDYFSKYNTPFINLLVKSGCVLLSFGGESGSQKILNDIQKDITPEDTIEAVKKCKLAGIQPVLSFMTNFPNETKKDVFETLSLIDELIEVNDNLRISRIAMYTPFPGSVLYDRAKEEGINMPKTLEDWSNFPSFLETIDLPWTKKSHKKLINTIAMISTMSQCNFNYVISAINRKKREKPLGRNGFLWKAYWNWMLLIIKIAQWRWYKRYFLFPIDQIIATRINILIKGYANAI